MSAKYFAIRQDEVSHDGHSRITARDLSYFTGSKVIKNDVFFVKKGAISGDRMPHLQHDHHHIIISTVHIHLNHDRCMEGLAARGQGRVIQKSAYELISMKGVIHGHWVGTTIGQGLK